jgi:hypothetical protein
LDDGQWHHIACVREAGTLSLFVDEVSEGSISAAGDVTVPVDLFIGARRHPSPDGALFFKGSIDEVKIYNSAVSVSKSSILQGTGISNAGVENAPGLDKEFNPNSRSADKAGKK